MAEAHSAVAFSFTVSEEGRLTYSVNHEAVFVAVKAYSRHIKKKWGRMVNRFRNGVYPASPSSWLIVVTCVFIALLLGWDISRYGLHAIEYMLIRYFSVKNYAYLYSCIVFSIATWLLGILVWRYFLLLLLSYHSWLYEEFGKPTNLTVMWMVLLKFFCGKNHKLYSCQSFLPKLPVPNLKSTIDRYLLSVRPIYDDEKYERVRKMADDFEKAVGQKLNFRLCMKSWYTLNYVSDWWEDFVYLYGRSPILINSNFYGLDSLLYDPSWIDPAARAATCVYSAILFRRSLDREELQPQFVKSYVPLCSNQYERLFNTTRIPGLEFDTLQHFSDSDHIVVYRKGKYYKCLIRGRDQQLRPVDLQKMFRYILEDMSNPDEGEERLAALTAGNRKEWAKIRQKEFSTGVNKASLDIIESAAFVLVFDDDVYTYERMNDYAKSMLHGNGYNRWLDKSFNMVISKNSRVGFNVEHSWADAPIFAHLAEYLAYMDFQHLANPSAILGYTESGDCVGNVSEFTPSVSRLFWNISCECVEKINEIYLDAKKMMDDLDLHMLVFKDFGKNLIKKMGVSPDAYVQMSLQLAQFRHTGKFCLTYESSMTRLFRNGRTETVRSCTMESCDFVRAMQDSNCDDEERSKLFKIAINKHQTATRDAMTGKGFDRHLFSLYVVDQYLKTNSPFLKQVVEESWRLSTSQTQHSQMNLLNYEKNPTYIHFGGGFGPVDDDGYGVSYLFAHEYHIIFHISSKHSCSYTSSIKFAGEIRLAMNDIAKMLSKAP